jgi:hypothetical protein
MDLLNGAAALARQTAPIAKMRDRGERLYIGKVVEC